MDKKILMNIKQLKSGKEFTAIIAGTPTKGIIEVVSGSVYLCQNDRDGVYTKNKHGYKYSWVINTNKDGRLNLGLAEVNSLKIKGLRKPPKKVFGYDFKIVKDKVIFGCGAVTLSKEEVQTFLKIHAQLSSRDCVFTEKEFDILTAHI